MEYALNPSTLLEGQADLCASETSQGNVETLCHKTKTKARQGGKGGRSAQEEGTGK